MPRIYETLSIDKFSLVVSDLAILVNSEQEITNSRLHFDNLPAYHSQLLPPTTHNNICLLPLTTFAFCNKGSIINYCKSSCIFIKICKITYKTTRKANRNKNEASPSNP